MKKNTDKNGKVAEKMFLQAYDAYGESILRHACFRVSDKSVAEDITSETFLKAWDYIRKNNEVKNFKGFFYQIADNIITDYYRTKKYRPIPIELVEEERLADPTDLQTALENQLSFKMVSEHLQTLPEDHRNILVYRYIDELDILTIKKLTGKSLTSIYVTIHRALKSLKEKIINTNGNNEI